jgi:hypothetical protein
MTKLFGLFAILFGCAYLVEGVTWLLGFLLSGCPKETFKGDYQLAVIILDCTIGLAALVIGVGLFFSKEWARTGWLGLLLFTLFGHFVVSLMEFVGFGVTPVNPWEGLVIAITLISWYYLTRETTKAKFHQNPPSAENPNG